MSKPTGYFESIVAGGFSAQAFIPHSLTEEEIRFDWPNLLPAIERATAALGRLDGLARILPDRDLFLYMLVRKEALLSSQIEGTQSTLEDLLLFDAGLKEETVALSHPDLFEVSNYVAATQRGIEAIREGQPLSLRLLRELHRTLLNSGRGSQKSPGDYRRIAIGVGGGHPRAAAYVPPPPQHVESLLSDLERFINAPQGGLPALARAAIAHVQFESIHPFLDGNGRLGRLLIALMFLRDGLMQHPLLYLSLYFKEHRAAYYDLLQAVRERGAWNEWLEFFLHGVAIVAEQSIQTIDQALSLFNEDESRLEREKRGSDIRVYGLLKKEAILSASYAAKSLSITPVTASASLARLQGIGIVREVTGQKKNRLYAYDRYLNILAQGAEPIRPSS